MLKRKNDPEDLDPDSFREEDTRLCSLHHKWLKELFIAVRGNGDVKHGLQYQVQTLVDTQKTIEKISWIVLIGVTANIFRVFGPVVVEHLASLIKHT